MSERDDETLDSIEAIDGFLCWFAPGLPPSEGAAVTVIGDETVGLGCHFARALTADEEASARRILRRQIERQRRYAVVASWGASLGELSGPALDVLRDALGERRFNRLSGHSTEATLEFDGSRPDAEAARARLEGAGVKAELRESVAGDLERELMRRQQAWVLRAGGVEQRLWPGALSAGGFLGRGERLADVLARDASALAALGVAPALVARRIREVVGAALQRYDEYNKAVLASRAAVGRFGMTFGAGQPDAAPPPGEKIDPGEGCAVEYFRVFWTQWRGFQGCPWGCEAEPKWASIDFRIENRRSGASFGGPGLIAHLIEAHGFFEGLESPYRVDPAQAVGVLELGPAARRQ